MIYALCFIVAIVSWYLPWWGFIPICFFAGIYCRGYMHSFFSGALSIFIVWVVYSYYFNMKSHGLMADKMAQMFSFPSIWMVFLLTGLLGALLGGLWCALGHSFYIHFWRREQGAH